MENFKLVLSIFLSSLQFIIALIGVLVVVLLRIVIMVIIYFPLITPINKLRQILLKNSQFNEKIYKINYFYDNILINIDDWYKHIIE